MLVADCWVAGFQPKAIGQGPQAISNRPKAKSHSQPATTGGAAPFVGFEQFSGSDSKGVTWFFGTSYLDPLGSTLTVSGADTGWQDLNAPVEPVR